MGVPCKPLFLTFVEIKEQHGAHQPGILTFTVGRQECRLTAHLEKTTCGTRLQTWAAFTLKRGVNHVCYRTLLKYCK